MTQYACVQQASKIGLSRIIPVYFFNFFYKRLTARLHARKIPFQVVTGANIIERRHAHLASLVLGFLHLFSQRARDSFKKRIFSW
jgi:hypothetical protein